MLLLLLVLFVTIYNCLSQLVKPCGTVSGKAAPNWTGGSRGKGEVSEHQEELQEPARPVQVGKRVTVTLSGAHIPAKDHLMPIF